MTKKTIITIAGKLGGGKSSTAKRVAELLNYQHLSTGEFMRAIGEKRGITLDELSKLAENDSAIDTELDDYNREVGKKEKIVLDSRLGFYFIPESFKVFLELDPKVAAERILKDAETNPLRHSETRQGFDTVEKIVDSINQRLESERKRYQEIYGIKDHTAHENFNLVIDTATIPLESVAQKIVEAYKKWLEN